MDKHSVRVPLTNSYYMYECPMYTNSSREPVRNISPRFGGRSPVVIHDLTTPIHWLFPFPFPKNWSLTKPDDLNSTSKLKSFVFMTYYNFMWTSIRLQATSICRESLSSLPREAQEDHSNQHNQKCMHQHPSRYIPTIPVLILLQVLS